MDDMAQGTLVIGQDAVFEFDILTWPFFGEATSFIRSLAESGSLQEEATLL